MLRAFTLLLCATLTSGCDPATSAGQPSRYAAPISQMFADPDVVDFFVAEAASANVTSIRVVHGLAAQAAGRTYGATTYNSGSNSANIEIFTDVPGANSPTNLAHEISHAWAFRHGCFNHGERWLAYHIGIAERFEARFPGVKWSGASPTQNVARKAARYPNDHC